MIVGCPILFVIDLIKHLSNLKIVSKYNQDHPNVIEAFNTAHGHNQPSYRGDPVRCDNKGTIVLKRLWKHY